MLLFRRIRGVLGAAAIWGSVFAVTGMGLATFLRWYGVNISQDVPSFVIAVAKDAFRFGMIGSVMGSLFALIIILAERNHSIDTLSARRIRLWGFLAGATVPIILTMILLIKIGYWLPQLIYPTGSFVAVAGTFGASIGALSLRLARRNQKEIGPAELQALPNR
jgi:hypothetical protein